MVAFAYGFRLQFRCVRTRRRLGHAKRLEADFAGRNARQVALLLLHTAVPKEHPHDVHLGVACTGVAAAGMNFLQNDSRGSKRKTRTAVLFRDQCSQIPGLRQLFHECFRIGVLVLDAFQ